DRQVVTEGPEHVEYCTSDARERCNRRWRRCITYGMATCAVPAIAGAPAWPFSAADRDPHSVHTQLGEERIGVGLVDQQTYWYWKSSDVFRYSVQVPIWALLGTLALIIACLWLLRSRMDAHRAGP